MSPVRWPAPAKLNLMLHVLGRRADGYHELQTVFRLIDLCDEIELAVRADGCVRRTQVVDGVPEDDDLTLRAARLLQSVSGTTRGVDIRLHKRIPAGGGLGGGSSDAATVLRVLNQLWDAGLDGDELARLGLELGADVPLFVAGVNAWAEGVGERLTPIELPPASYLVVHPGCAVATAEVFGAPDLTRSTPPTTIQRFLAGAGSNDCTAAVVRRYAAVGEALEWLGRHGDARLSGTGACVFLPCAPALARALLEELPEGWRGWLVNGLTQSPLNTLLPADGPSRRDSDTGV